MIQVVSAVEYLHSNKIVHRDLKLGNLFVDKQFAVKLGDFGLAIAIEYEGQKRFSRCGTPNYIAPEVINGIGYSYEVDVWALGCILHTMLEGTPPFQGPNTTTTYNNIIRCQYRPSSRINYSAQTLIMSSLQVNPKLRPTIYEMKNFEFLISRDISPKPPQFDFGNARRMSTIRKGRVATAAIPTNPFDPNQLDSKEFPKSCFFKIAKCLVNIKKWPESDFGEFLSEASSLKPLDWVNSWMDFSNSYGFAYTLSSSDYGIIFNDETRMLLQNKEQYVHYVHSDGSDIICQKSSIPAALSKKLKILIHCGKYMKESLIQAHEGNPPDLAADEDKPIVEVFKWTKGEAEMVMMLTNGSIQVNFSSDHTKLILCGSTKTVTVIESANYMKTLKLDNLQNCGAGVQLKQKLSVILKYVTSFLSE
ncbi:serine/threonine-protein kinase PLK1-like [Homalodisca vitripennis]|uniref:serine/threonine-protein kinase PLK1-like n=2 Tax=Homalodisca vitripennis TaxID=197043 RepID=UPI001EEC99E0|nr:serine/threonine-protein kinase PLK1-like [Homalodisca vitripennis]